MRLPPSFSMPLRPRLSAQELLRKARRLTLEPDASDDETSLVEP